jgi:hypothetical protein
MKASNILKVAVLALPLVLSSCGSKKKLVEEKEKPVAQVSSENKQLIEKINDNAQGTKFVSSKVKFSVEVGNQNITLTGNLRMMRDDVIRLQLMAFGFVEAARLEFTKDYVLIMDRINKQYLMAPYVQIDFLRNSGINFYTLQALFWNELFLPNRTSVSKEEFSKFTTSIDNGEAIISLTDNKMTYSWLVNESNGTINMANILYKDRFNGNTQLNWDYLEFSQLEKKRFPTNMNIILNAADKKEIKMGIKLNYLGTDSEWERRTTVSNKYREVTVDEILKRFMAL